MVLYKLALAYLAHYIWKKLPYECLWYNDSLGECSKIRWRRWCDISLKGQALTVYSHRLWAQLLSSTVLMWLLPLLFRLRLHLVGWIWGAGVDTSTLAAPISICHREQCLATAFSSRAQEYSSCTARLRAKKSVVPNPKQMSLSYQ